MRTTDGCPRTGTGRLCVGGLVCAAAEGTSMRRGGKQALD